MGERGFETANLGGDLWAMGFDVDLALETHNRKANGNHGAVGPSGNSVMGYGDMQHMLLHTARFDDELNDGDISQITDLTNSLPKGDAESAQNFLAKACHDLSRELGATHGTVQKSIEASLFSSVNDVSGHNNSVINQKAQLLPIDVYGRITLCEGKLVLQLRHINVSTNYPVSIGECWLCREKISNGSSLNSHKHVLQGVFQVNNEFVQMDIDHYIIPEQALEPDPTDVNRNLSSSNLITSANPSAMGHNRSLTLGGDMECSGPLQEQQHVNLNTIGSALHNSNRPIIPNNESLQTPKCATDIHHYTESDLNSALSSAPPQPLSSSSSSVPMDSNSFLSPFANSDLRLGTVIPQTPSDAAVLINHANDTVSPTSTSFHSPTLPLSSCNNNGSMIPGGGTAESNSSLNDIENIQALCTANNATPRNDGFIPHGAYDPSIGGKGQIDNYQSFFNQSYSYYENAELQHIPKFPTNNNNMLSPPTQLYESLSAASSAATTASSRRTEVGAKKRKGSKAKKKLSAIILKEETKSCPPAEGGKKSCSEGGKTPPLLQSVNSGGSSCSLENKPQNVSSSLIPKKVKSESSTSCEVVSSSIPSPVVDFNINCPFCKVQFPSKQIAEFKLHVGRHNYDPSYLFECPVCWKKSASCVKHIQHLKIHIQKRHFCSLCESHYSRADKLRRHVINVHESEKPFVCDICSKAFNRMEYLKAHKNIHLGKKFECDICHKLYSSQFNLQAHHKQQHSTKKLPFACNLCDKSYLRKDYLDLHISKDHNKKRYKCDICFKSCSRDDILRRHKEKHNDKRVTFNCDLCSKRFSRNYALKAHLREHKYQEDNLEMGKKLSKSKVKSNWKSAKTKELKEQCKICLKYMPSILKLEKHMRLHDTKAKNDENPFACSVCPKSFKTMTVLKRHLSRIHPQEDSPPREREANAKKFCCDFCPKGFSRSCNLKTHLKTHFKNSEDDEVLAEIPTVLNASKAKKSSRKKKSYLSLSKNANGTMTYSPVELISSASCSNSGAAGGDGAKELHPSGGASSLEASFEKNLDPSSNPCQQYTAAQLLPTSHLPNDLPMYSSWSSCSSPNSPINLSTEAISAAAYLLTHPFYEGPY